MAGRNISGVLLLDKPYGMSSNHALRKVKYLYASAKSGHTGTLDPLATGMLPICMGEATKFTSVLLNASKSYEAVIKLGYQSTTGDAEGVIKKLHDVAKAQLNAQYCKSELKQFIGEIQQIPPMYSALKHLGKPLYAYARKGTAIERKPRKVIIYDLQIKMLSGDELVVLVRCGTGTYIRVLAEDIGKALGCGSGYLIHLKRKCVGNFHLDQVQTFETLEKMDMEKRERCLLPIDSILQQFPAVSLNRFQTQAILYGRTIAGSNDMNMIDQTLQENIVRLYYQQVFLGLGEIILDQQILKPKRMLSSAYLHSQGIGLNN
ncbi:tRNA pseudouridine synthase B [Nitrosomonas marina]|uniref:tRNA pseudouridine synthase B n=1 Tax=Nitrosomonas marina TaxID=917 RepID=A0A1I0EPX5_9PROT|nr:tRNA pseudouridine(55) synthase TruB [Nitrosomonas marina]SET47341.1 tRNA pseudouridine synthase B [Nitrosomonas marina]